MDFRHTHVAIPADVLARELEGESVILNLETERYYGLDQVGTRTWNVITTASSLDAAFDVLLAEYDVDPDTLRTDMANLIEELAANGLLTVLPDD
jgi:hypothetical protein